MLAQRGSAKADMHRSLAGRCKCIHIALTLEARISRTKAAFCTVKITRDAHLRVSLAIQVHEQKKSRPSRRKKGGNFIDLYFLPGPIWATIPVTKH